MSRNSQVWNPSSLIWIAIVLGIMVVVAIIPAIVKVYISLRTSIQGYKDARKKKENSNLFYSFAMGSGFFQCQAIFQSAVNSVVDTSWMQWGFVYLSKKIGAIANSSKGVLFLYSLAYIPLLIMSAFELFWDHILGFLIYTSLAALYCSFLLIIGVINIVLLPFINIADRVTWRIQHCPNCYAKFSLPIFECPLCRVGHKQLVPSFSGLFQARCTCGQILPCSSFSRRKELTSHCPKCDCVLPSSNIRAFTVQLIGGDSSGKTAFIASVQRKLIESIKSVSSDVISTAPEIAFNDLNWFYDSGYTRKSANDKVNAYYIMRIGTRNNDNGIIIYDVPDEIILNDQYERNPINFSYCDGLVIIVDPLSISSVRRECEKVSGTQAIKGYSADAPDDIIIHFINKYSEIVGRSAKKMSDIPVAIVLTKADLPVVKQSIGYARIQSDFSSTPGKYGSVEEARNRICRKFLIDIGLTNALNNLDSVFGNIAFFPVSSIGHTADGSPFNPDGVLNPIDWLAEQSKRDIFNLS